MRTIPRTPARPLPWLAFSVWIVLCGAQLVCAQGIITGAISGTVTDPRGAVVPGAVVTAVELRTGARRDTLSMGNGDFYFQNAPIGTYTVAISATGFRPVRVEDVRVVAGVTSDLGSEKLGLGGVASKVEVQSSNSVQLDTTESQVSTTFSALQIESLPLANGFDSIALLVPGVARTLDDTFSNTNGSGAGFSSESEYATVTSSRLDATMDALPSATFTLKTPPPSSQSLVSPYGLGTIEGYVNSLPLDPTAYTSLYDIANFFCYRYSTLTTPSASEIGYSGKTPPTASIPVLQQMLNGYYRMTPIMLQGVPSFAVDWTDGAVTVPAAPPATAQLIWYGLDDPLASGTTTNPATDGAYLPLYSGAAGTKVLPNPEAVHGNSVSPSGGIDGLTYVFYAGNKPAWPKALKITYCVTDPNNRLQGGRFVTQVVNLPQ